MKQMSGIPRPVNDLPDRAISVRVIRGDLSHNVTGQPVELHVGTDVRTVKTDDSGRAQFDDVPAGATIKAVTTVDGERLESQEFPAPERGGVRLMLVATDTSKKSEAAPPQSPVSGQVSLSGQSRIVIEPGDEAVQVFYLLDVVNKAQAPVNPATPFTFDMPTGAVGTSLMEGSSPQASVSGTRIRVQGPFAPGTTVVQAACEIPALTASLQIAQKFPAPLDQLAIVVKKLGETRLTSPQIERQQDMSAQGETFIAATGPGVAAGQPIVLTLDDLPHHSPVPRRIALVLAVVIVMAGVWAASRRDVTAARAAERARLVARRDKLFADLVRLETDHRRGRGNPERYASRREELIVALEHVYGALDDTPQPEPADGAGLAA